MKNTLYLVVFTILLFILNSCSDDNGTDPSDEFVGASFKYKDNMIWEYDTYYSGKPPASKYYVLTEYIGEYEGKRSYKRYRSYLHYELEFEFDKENFVYTSDDDNSLYFFYSKKEYDHEGDTYIPYSIFPELYDKWFKFIDYSKGKWKQYDLRFDGITENGDEYYYTFEWGGEKLYNYNEEFEDSLYAATKYKVYGETTLIVNGMQMSGAQNDLELIYTVIDGVGIYQLEYKGGTYRTLVNHYSN